MSSTNTNSNNIKNNNIKNNNIKNNNIKNDNININNKENSNKNNSNDNNSNDNNSNDNNSNSIKKNNSINNFINKHKNKIIYAKEIYENSTNVIINAPMQIKILNIIICIGITYLFTNIYYNLTLSIICALLTTVTFFVFGRYYGLIFLILYVIYVNKIISSRNLVLGNFIGNTDISSNGPLKCSFDEKQTPQTIPAKYYKDNLSSASFSYSMWLFVNNSNSLYDDKWNNYRYNEWKSILYAGTSEITTSDTSNLNQYPGFWMTPKLNNIVITFQSNSNKVDKFEVKNFPMNEWFHLTCVVERNSVSIYINCEMQNSFNLHSIIPGDYTDYNLYIANDARLSNTTKNGFPGFLGNLSYYNYALNQTQIDMICNNYGQQFKALQSKENKNNNNSCTKSCLVTDSDQTAVQD